MFHGSIVALLWRDSVKPRVFTENAGNTTDIRTWCLPYKIPYVRFQVLTAASVNVASWDTAPCSFAETDRHTASNIKALKRRSTSGLHGGISQGATPCSTFLPLPI
jgi:hypothetical protein